MLNNAYMEGYEMGVTRRWTNSAIQKRLRKDPDFWQGWHDGRPDGLTFFLTCLIEDPTRPTGWCVWLGHEGGKAL